MNFHKTSEILPEDCSCVLVKYDDGNGELYGIMTVIDGEWALDASEAELYGTTPHLKVGKGKIPYEWAYL